MNTGQLVEQATDQVFALGFEPVTIGRHEESDIVLADPQASRHHAEIAMQGGRWVIRDLGSANGTFVNGQRITGLHVLNPDDLIQVGQTSFRVKIQVPVSAQDTLVERRPVAVPPPARSGVSGPVLGLILVAVALLIVAGALLIRSVLQEDGDVAQQPSTPNVTVVAPADGAQIAVGVPFNIQAQASDAHGVLRIDVLVDGVLVHQVPGGANQTMVVVDTTWTFEGAGPHAISVTAHGADELQSTPAVVNIVAIGSGPQPGDLEPSPEAAETPIPTAPPPTLEPTIAPPTPTPVPPPPTDTPAPPPIIGFFRADQTAIEQGACARLEWGQVEHATSVTLTGVGRVEPAGKLDVCPDATRTYTLEAAGPGGTAQQNVQITVQAPLGPVIDYFRVVPSIISPGDCAQLEWGKVDNATSATIDQGIGGVGTPGSQEVCPSTTTTYLLTAQNPEGTATAEATLYVSSGTDPQPVIAFFTANPSSIRAGECTTLSWGKVDYAFEVTIDNNIGGVATPGSKEICLGVTTTFVMTAVGPGGTTEDRLTVTVSPGQLANLPDIVIESILFNPNPCYRGERCKVRIKVRNDGPVAAAHFVVRWAPAGEEAIPVEWDVDSLAAGREKELTYPWFPNRAEEKWWTLAIADLNDEVGEIEEEAANILEQSITVLEP
jgi:pSer/pThr/pTyr-binding forkhead associated (FHA) protein